MFKNQCCLVAIPARLTVAGEAWARSATSKSNLTIGGMLIRSPLIKVNTCAGILETGQLFRIRQPTAWFRWRIKLIQVWNIHKYPDAMMYLYHIHLSSIMEWNLQSLPCCRPALYSWTRSTGYRLARPAPATSHRVFHPASSNNVILQREAWKYKQNTTRFGRPPL